MLLNREQIIKLAQAGMINPFVSEKVDTLPNGAPCLSYGLESFGYTCRLASTEFFQIVERGNVIDPKNFDKRDLRPLRLIPSTYGDYFVMPPRAVCLGVTVERFRMPLSIIGIMLGKSSYARIGNAAFMTPIEAGWVGHVTTEHYNALPDPVRIYAGEGVAQVLFFRGDAPSVAYKGRYQNQPAEVITARG
jgi:dCTP deaminase